MSRGNSTRAVRLAVTLAMLVALVPLVAAPASAATTYYVDDGGSNTDAGTEAAPFRTITYAMTKASAGDTIIVEPGTYDTALGETFPITLKPGVTLKSSSGSGLTTIQGDEAHNVIDIHSPTANTTLEGFKVTGTGSPEVPVSIYRPSGGGPLVGWPRVVGNDITGNHTQTGAGIWMRGQSDAWCEPYIADNEIHNNEADDSGGAIYCFLYAKPVIVDNHIHDNVASAGGAIDCFQDVKLTLKGNTFEGNDADTHNGGAVSVSDASVEVLMEDNLFVGNRTTGIGGAGGAVHAMNAEVNASRNVFTANEAGDGGAIWMNGASGTLENNVFYDNYSGDGGVVWAGNSTLDCPNNTIYGNRRAPTGGWAGVYVGGTGTVTFSNSIIWGHDDEDVWGTTIRYSITEQTDLGTLNTEGPGVIHTDPMFFDAASDDFRLLIGSPAIDTASAADAPADDIEGTSRPQDGDGDGTAADDMGAWERPGLGIARYSGLDRYETAALIATGNFTDADVAILASGENFPDALAAAGLAGSYEAPLLLTRTASLPNYTSDALADLGVTDVVIIGGSGAVSDAVANALDADYDITRIWGPTRYETAAEVAAEIADMEGADFVKRAFVARGDEYPDALAISPFAYDAKVPILLTYTDLLAPATAEALDDLDIEGGVVTGGEGAVSAAVKSGVDAITTANGGSATVRYGGIDRYETAAIIAEDGVDAGYGSWDYVGFATGLNFPDALAGGVAAGANGGVILLTRTDVLPSFTADALADHGAEVLYAEVYGGPGAVAPVVEDAIFDALGW